MLRFIVIPTLQLQKGNIMYLKYSLMICWCRNDWKTNQIGLGKGDKERPCIFLVTMMRKLFNVIERLFWLEETGTKNYNYFPGFLCPKKNKIKNNPKQKKSSCSTFSKSSFFLLFLCFEFLKRIWISPSTLMASPSWMRVTLHSSVLWNAQALWTLLVCPMQWSTVRMLWSKFTMYFTKSQCKEVTTGFETNILGHLQSNLYSYQAMHLHVSLNVKTREIWFCQGQ